MSASKVVLRILHVCITLLIAVLVAVAVLQLGGKAYDLGYRVYTEPPVSKGEGQDKVVEISAGMSASEIGALLEEKGLVRDGTLFMAQMKLSAYDKKVKPGLYTLNTAQTAREMLQLMSEEDTKDEADGKEGK